MKVVKTLLADGDVDPAAIAVIPLHAPQIELAKERLETERIELALMVRKATNIRMLSSVSCVAMKKASLDS